MLDYLTILWFKSCSSDFFGSMCRSKDYQKIHAKSSNPAGATILWCFIFVKCDQKYTTFFAIFSLDANKKRAPEQPFDRLEAQFCPYFA